MSPLSEEMSVKAEEGEERGAEKYLREVMGVVEEKEQRREQQRKTRRKEAEQEGGARRKEAEEGGGQARRRQEAKAKKMKVEKVLVEEELVCQGPLIVTKLVFLVSLCLFLTSSALLLSDYKQKDSLALRQTVGTLGQISISLILKNTFHTLQVASLPSFEAPAMLKKLPDLTSIADTAREAFVQVCLSFLCLFCLCLCVCICHCACQVAQGLSLFCCLFLSLHLYLSLYLLSCPL